MADIVPPRRPGKDWIRDSLPRPSTSKVGRQLAIWALVGLFLALIGIAVAWLTLPQSFQPPFFLFIALSEYRDDHFPPLAFSEQDAIALEKQFAEDRRKRAFNSQTAASIRRELNDFAKRDEQAVVLYVRALALTRDESFFLIPSEASCDNPDDWLPLSELLEPFKHSKAKHALLILDLMSPCADARLGMLTENSAEAMNQYLRSHADPRLLILCSCSGAQISHSSEDLQQSVFGYYLAQGLSGCADGALDQREDLRVSVRELEAYVKEHVEAWVWRNRGQKQTPVLFGSGQDFGLAQYQTRPAKPESPVPALYPDWLVSKWTQLEQWKSAQIFRVAPRECQELHAKILAAEQLWRAGKMGSVLANGLEADFRELSRRVHEALRLSKPGSMENSHALAQLPELNAGDDALFAAFMKQFDPAKTEQSMRNAELYKQVSYGVLAQLVWKHALQEDVELTRSRLHELVALLSAHPKKAMERYLEIGFLEHVDQWHQADTNWPVDLVRPLLLAVHRREQLCARPPTTLSWFYRRLDDANEKLRRARADFFAGRWDTLKPALEKISQDYEEMLGTIKTIGEAQQILDEARLKIPGSQPYLARCRDFSADYQRSWRESIETADGLLDALEIPPDKSLPAQIEIERNVRKLAYSLEMLRKPFSGRELQKLLDPAAAATPAQLEEMENRLWGFGLYPDDAVPKTSANTKEPRAEDVAIRVKFYDAIRQNFARSSAEVMAFDRVGKVGPSNAGKNEPIHESVTIDGKRQALLVKELLHLAGSPDWRLDFSNGNQVREAWGINLPKLRNGAASDVKAERLTWAMHPLEAVETRQFLQAERIRQAKLQKWKWLALLYEKEASQFDEKDDFREYLDSVSRDYRRLLK